MNLSTKQKKTQRCGKQTQGYPKVTPPPKVVGGDKLGVWDYIYTVLYIKNINSNNLLYITKNYSQYLVITYNGKGSEKKCTIESLYCTFESNTF